MFSFVLGLLYEGLKLGKELVSRKTNTFSERPAINDTENGLRTFIPYRYYFSLRYILLASTLIL